MPNYVLECQSGHRWIRYATLDEYEHNQRWTWCEQCEVLAAIRIQPPILVSAQQECRYDSPVTGEIITTWDQRREDLKRHNCRPYDPEMKTDAARFHKEMDAKVDQQIDEQVERTFEKMPTKQRGKLASEVLDQGVGLDVGRASGNPLA